MTMKKMLLLAGMALAAVAFATPPAQAHAPEWYIHTESGEETLAGEAEFTTFGEIGSQAVGSPLTEGPCEIEFTGTASNEAGMAAGQIEGANVLSTPCPTNLPGCTVNPDISNFNWPITGVEITGEPGLEIRNMTFTKTFATFCQTQYGIPKEISVTGTITGIVEGADCLTLEGHQDDLFIENAAKEDTASKVNLEGGICIEGPTLH